eukprot:1176904-Prorocentrum_minimum.AAC.4
MIYASVGCQYGRQEHPFFRKVNRTRYCRFLLLSIKENCHWRGNITGVGMYTLQAGRVVGDPNPKKRAGNSVEAAQNAGRACVASGSGYPHLSRTDFFAVVDRSGGGAAYLSKKSINDSAPILPSKSTLSPAVVSTAIAGNSVMPNSVHRASSVERASASRSRSCANAGSAG